MNASRQAAWSFCALLALACSGFYFASTGTVARQDLKTLSQTADFHITNLTLKQFDASGKMGHFLQSPLVWHLPESDTHFFKTPRLSLTESNQSTWHIRAKLAAAKQKGQEITFTHQVVIHQNKNDGSKGSTLQTEELTYLPKERLAKSDAAIRFEQPGSVVHSQGMKAYLNEKRIQLLNKTRATFEPKHA
ncbi:MAG: LPS export ABC transporter periplasmic protein LptC [Tatlockia sp.]|jgi:lipopolysaccharide export system protein LptC